MTHLEIENLASDYLEGLLEPLARVEHLRRRRPDQGHGARHPPGAWPLVVAHHLPLGLLAPLGASGSRPRGPAGPPRPFSV